MGGMYETKVYDISIDHCLCWGMQHGYVYSMYIWWSWVWHMCSLGLVLYNHPQLRMVLPFGISKFSDVVCALWLDCISLLHKYITLGATNGERLHNVIEYPKNNIHSQSLSFTFACIVVCYMNVCSDVYIYVCRYIGWEDVYRKFSIQAVMRLNHTCYEFL